MKTKWDYRREYKAIRSQGIDEHLRLYTSARIIECLSQGVNPQGLNIGGYMALTDEPDLLPLFQHWQSIANVYLPRVEGDEEMNFYPFMGIDSLTQAGKYQIFEPNGKDDPIDPSMLDVIIIPAIAFDRQLYRLGRGKGYYDRYLAKTQARRIGVTLSLMRVDSLPRDQWDIPMHEVVVI